MFPYIFIANLFVTTVALAIFKQVSKYWWVAFFMGISVFECIVVGKASPSWEVKHVVASWALGNIFPWGVAGLYLWLSPYPRKAILIASGLPIVYVFALVIGLAVGDASGLIPQ